MMANGWQTAPLAQVLRQDTNYVTELEPKIYPKLSVKLYGKGATLDAPTDGATVKMQRHQFAKPGQVILSEIWAKKGAIGIVPPNGEGALVTSHFFLFDIDETKVLPAFISWLLKGNFFAEALDAQAHGTTGYAAVRPKQFLALEIPLPPLTEQSRIVARIEALAARVAEAQALRREAAEEAKVLLQSRTNQILEEKAGSGTWKWGFLPDFVASSRHAIKRGPFGSHLRKEYFIPSGYKVYEQKHAIYGDFTAGSYFVDEEKFQQLKSFEVKPGDIIISCSGTIGKVAIVPETAEPGIINQALLKLTLETKKIDRQFFKIVFESDFIKQEVAAMSLGSAMKNIGSVKILKKIKFPLPPLEEQRRLVAYLDGLQAQVSALRGLQVESTRELVALLPSVLDRAFRGEL